MERPALDPFVMTQRELEDVDLNESQLPDPVDPKSEIEGLENSVSDRLMEARDVKIAKEAEVRAAYITMQEAHRR